MAAWTCSFYHQISFPNSPIPFDSPRISFVTFFMYLVIISHIKVGSLSIFVVISFINFSLNISSFFLFKFHHLIFGLIILRFVLTFIFIRMSATIILCCEVKLSPRITLQSLYVILSTFLDRKSLFDFYQIYLLTPNHSSDGFSHGICKTMTGQKPGPGFFPDRRHSDAQVSGAWKRVGQQIKNGAMARERIQSPLEGGLVTLL